VGIATPFVIERAVRLTAADQTVGPLDDHILLHEQHRILAGGRLEQRAGDVWREPLQYIALPVQEAVDDRWLVDRPAVGYRRHGIDQLQHRGDDIPLPEGRVVRVACRPVLALGAALPVRIGHPPRALAGQLNAQLRADAKGGRVTVQIVDAQPAGSERRLGDFRVAAANLIEIHITALGNGLHHGYRPMTGAQPAHECL